MASRRDPTRVVARRCLQAAIDRSLVLAAAGLVFLTSPVPALAGALRSVPAAERYAPLLGFAVLVVLGTWGNEVWLPSRNRGATLGMRLTGLRAVTEDGLRPPLRAWTVRWALSVVDGMLFGAVGLAVMLSSRFHQRFGDIIAGTYVVRGAWLSADEPRLPGPDRDLGAVAQADLALGARQVRLDGRG